MNTCLKASYARVCSPFGKSHNPNDDGLTVRRPVRWMAHLMHGQRATTACREMRAWHGPCRRAGHP
eukprot:12611072-Alexandrium_andersonii.AAC.1